MKIRVRHDHGIGIGILIAVLLFLIALFMLIYLLITLLRIPPRQLPDEAMNHVEYVIEPDIVASFAKSFVMPDGFRYKQAPLLASTNLTHWSYIYCDVDTAGFIHTPDGTILQLHGEWSEELGEWVKFWPVVISGGTNETMMFRIP